MKGFPSFHQDTLIKIAMQGKATQGERAARDVEVYK